MKRKWTFTDVLILLAFFAVVAGVTFGVSALFQSPIEPGDVEVISGGQRVTTLRRVIAAPARDGGVREDTPFAAEIDGEAFPLITMEGSIVLNTPFDPWGSMYYTAYSEDFAELYYRSEKFRLPEEPGLYYFIVDTKWGSQKEYFSTQHGFKLLIE